jgi:uncharacterized protein YndB with AHSA1/START domain/uncharacterized protein YciI
MNARKSAARAVADLTAGNVLATVEIAAPPERVFEALTSSEELVKWWGSDDTYRTHKWTADLRAGGHWRAEGRGADGSPFSVEGDFLEIDPPRKLVQTWTAPWDGGNTTTITYRLEPIEGGTRVTLRHEGFVGRPQSCEGHSEGWERVLGWLGSHFVPPAPTKFFLCRLVSPRPTFAQDMNEREASAMREHATYWKKMAELGVAVVFGPVLDPKGVWGLGIVEAKDESEVRALQADDPAIKSEIGLSYETLPLLRAIVRP